MTAHPDIARLATMIASQAEAVDAAAAQGNLADWLYHHWYLAPGEGFTSAGAPPPFNDLAAGLSAIVDTLSPWHEDWTVLTADAHDGCLVGKGNERRWAEVGRYAGIDRPGLPPMPGDRISLPDHLAWCDRETGQWAAQSATPPGDQLVRLYVNIGADGIGHAVLRIVAWLIEEDIPFRMKCPGAADGFTRADTLVLYLDRANWPARQAEVLNWAKEIEPLMRSGRPALTQPLAPGIGFAEDPGDGRSFGQHRCDMLADAVASMPDRSSDVATQLEHAIVAAGISASEPWKCVE